MLVLTRKQNESIRIGDDIVVTVTQIRGNRIQLGIEAPKDVRVVRGELVRHEATEVSNPLLAFHHATSDSGEFNHACASVAK